MAAPVVPALRPDDLTGTCVRELRPTQLDRDDLVRWEQLERRALEPNPFLSPLLVLPSIRHLRPDSDVRVVLIERRTNEALDLLGVGVFERVGATRLLPLPHVKAYETSSTTFLTGLLLDRDQAEAAGEAFFSFAAQQSGPWQHLEFSQRSVGSALDAVLSSVARRAGKRWCGTTFDRPLLEPHDRSLTDRVQQLSRSRRKQVRRCVRDLQALGPISFEVIRDRPISDDELNDFLKLEHGGWKAGGGTSLLGHPRREAFFREMALNFAAAGRLCLTRYCVGDTLIGSSVCLEADRMAVAFKLGWDEHYAAMSPGILHALALAQEAGTALADLEYLDGGTAADSWLLPFWPGRRTVSTGVFVGSRRAEAAHRLTRQLVAAKRRVKGLRRWRLNRAS